jgi:cell division protein ZapB
MIEQDLRTLNARIDSLILKLQAVSAENAKLRAAVQDTLNQRASADEAAPLRAKVEALNTEISGLRSENSSLRAREAARSGERDELSRKNDLARARVEAIILRLKALETPEA